MNYGSDFLVDRTAFHTKRSNIDEVEIEEVECSPYVKDVLKQNVLNLKPKVQLDVACVFSFEKKSVVIGVTNERNKFNVDHAELKYSAQSLKIGSVARVGNKFNFIVPLDELDRHVFETKYQIIFQYSVECLELKVPNNKVVLSATFKFEIPHFQERTELVTADIPNYYPPNEVRTLLQNKMKPVEGLSEELTRFIRSHHERTKEKKETTNYTDRLQELQFALHFEDSDAQKFYERLSCENATISWCEGDVYCVRIAKKVHRDKLIECRIRLNRMDSQKGQSIMGVIEDAFMKKVYFVRRGFLNHLVKYRIDIVSGRAFVVSSQNAIDFAKKKNLIGYLESFEVPPAKQQAKPKGNFSNFNWSNKNIQKNEEQKLAVKNIVNCTAFPFPYVVFGPPGTGKTTILVEAIVQILNKKPGSKVLVTCQSNATCDEIGTRLLNFLSRSKVFRWYAKSMIRKFDELNPNLVRTSNIRNRAFENVSYEEFKSFDVVIVTLISSKLIHRAMISSNHFDYIFIDECASTVEPESLIPITGLGSMKENITASIVLLGDHKQLGAVVKCRVAVDMGLKESLMERIMKQKNYSSHDPNFVTQLLHNYRSHPDILRFCNEKFYNSTLRAVGNPMIINSACNWGELPNKKIPMIFHSVKSFCQKNEDDESWVNYVETNLVRQYVRDILKNGINGKSIDETQIGVISPYRGQVEVLQEKLYNHSGVDIGVIENFQGREKDIIILSMVKSNKFVGFLKCEKRFNTAMTRARSLMIIIGNPITLSESKIWRDFLGFCSDNNLVVGLKYKLKEENNLNADAVAADLQKLSIK